jgi:hypothetical protein
VAYLFLSEGGKFLYHGEGYKNVDWQIPGTVKAPEAQDIKFGDSGADVSTKLKEPQMIGIPVALDIFLHKRTNGDRNQAIPARVS